MAQKYLYSLIVIVFLTFSFSMEAQTTSKSEVQSQHLEELAIYPNPAPAEKIFISTKSPNKIKVEIYNVLGKKIHSNLLAGREMNISFLTSGIYMLKIEQDGETVTRKLMVK